MTGATIMVRLVLFSLVRVTQRCQRHFVPFAALLILWPDVLHAGGMLQILVLILPTSAQVLNHVSDARIYSPEDKLFVFLHANGCVIVYASYPGAQFTATRREALLS